MIFSPTIETVNDSKAFLTEDPAKLLKTGNFHNKVPLVMGVNAEEGLLYTSCKNYSTFYWKIITVEFEFWRTQIDNRIRIQQNYFRFGK